MREWCLQSAKGIPVRLWCRRGALGRYSSERTAFGAPWDAFERGLRTTWGAFLASAVPQEGLEALFCGRTHELHVIWVFTPPLSPWPGRLFFVPGGSFSCPHTGFGVILPPGVFFPLWNIFLIPGQGGRYFLLPCGYFSFPVWGGLLFCPAGYFLPCGYFSFPAVALFCPVPVFSFPVPGESPQRGERWEKAAPGGDGTTAAPVEFHLRRTVRRV